MVKLCLWKKYLFHLATEINNQTSIEIATIIIKCNGVSESDPENIQKKQVPLKYIIICWRLIFIQFKNSMKNAVENISYGNSIHISKGKEYISYGNSYIGI